MSKKYKIVTLGGGCFWCLEASYKDVVGVMNVVNGYAGGVTDRPTYETVCSGTTGHAEVIQITYDPIVISFKKLLDIFWFIHNPTTLDAQGADIGSQYRSIILYHDINQMKIAKESMLNAQKNFLAPIVTQIEPFKKFWPAESYHQNYFQNYPNQGYCRMVIKPKVDKVKHDFKTWLK